MTSFKDNITKKLHGFVPGRSILTNLMQLSNQVTKAFEQSNQVDAVYLDMSKAFDTVDHSILLDKLKLMGINDNMLRWLTSYLSDRYQIVQLGGFSSDPFKVTSGVTQGSRLGPFMFSVFINDLPKVVKHSVIELFTDDCRVSIIVNNNDDTIKLQDDLDNIIKWIRENKLSINVPKCQKITFSRGNKTIDSDYFVNGAVVNKVDKIRDLGVILDCGWTFREHIDTVIAKSYRTLGFIKRLTQDFTSLDTITYLFKTLVLPNMNYGSIIWSPYTTEKFDGLNGVLRKFMRYASFKAGKLMRFDDHDYKEISNKCKIYNVESIHKYNDIVFVLNNLKNKTDSPDFYDNFKERDLTYDLRDFRQFQEDVQKHDYLYNSPIHRLRRRWNTLNQDFRRDLLDMNLLNKLKSTLLENF